MLANVLPSFEKGRKSLLYRGKKCLNCEHPLDKSDRFCPNCSQLNSTKKLHFKDLFQEFFAGLIAYDSRLMLTLRVILFQPGKISKEYIEGKRMRYANPFRFYLSVSILFFLLYALLTKIDSYSVNSGNDQNNKNWIATQTTNSHDDNILVFDNNSAEKMNHVDPENPFSKLSDSLTEDVLKQLHFINTTQKTSPNTQNTETRKTLSLFGNDSISYYTQQQLDSIPKGKNLFTKFEIYWGYYNKNPEKKTCRCSESITTPVNHKKPLDV